MDKKHIEEMTNQVENKIYESENKLDKEKLNNIIKETIDNFQKALSLSNKDRLEAHKQISASINQRLYNNKRQANQSKSINPIIEDILSKNIRYAAIDLPNEKEYNMRFVNEFFGEEIVACLLPKTNKLFLYDKSMNHEEVQAAINKEDNVSDIRESNGIETITVTQDLYEYKDMSDEEIAKEFIPAGSYRNRKDGDVTIIDDGTTQIEFEWVVGIPVRTDIKQPTSNLYERIKEQLKKDNPDMPLEELHEKTKETIERISEYEEQTGPTTHGMPLGDEKIDYNDIALNPPKEYEPTKTGPNTLELDYIAKQSRNISKDHLPGWVGPDFETHEHQSPYVQLDDESPSINKILYGDEEAEPEEVNGYLTYNKETGEFEYIFADEVIDTQTGNPINSIVFTKEELEEVFKQMDIEDASKGESIPASLYIKNPLAKKKRRAFNIKASNVVMSKEQAIKADIDFITPLKNYVYANYGIFLEEDAVNIIISELKDIYGELKSFNKYSKKVIDNLTNNILKNPDAYELYSFASKIDVGDKVILLSVPGNPTGIVREANDKYLVEYGDINDPFKGEYQEDELMKVEKQSKTEESTEFGEFDKIISLRRKTRKILSKTLENIKVGDVLKQAKIESQKGWLKNIEIPNPITLNDYDINKEIILRSNKKGIITGKNKNGSLRVKINNNEIPVWKSEIKRRTDNV